MAIGLPVTKNEIDTRSGDIARGFQKIFGDVLTMKSYLDQTPDGDLEALGYTPNEIAVIKTAFSDLLLLTNIWTGNEKLTNPKDFREFVRRLWGVGSF